MIGREQSGLLGKQGGTSQVRRRKRRELSSIQVSLISKDMNTYPEPWDVWLVNVGFGYDKTCFTGKKKKYNYELAKQHGEGLWFGWGERRR